MIFHENCLLADNSHETSCLIFFPKLRKMSKNSSSAAVVICALRVNIKSKSYPREAPESIHNIFRTKSNQPYLLTTIECKSKSSQPA